MTDPTQTPISVTASGTKVVSKESLKILLTGVLAAAATQFVHSEVAMLAIVPATGVLAVWAYGVIERLHNWRVSKHLANAVPDETAVVGPVK